MEWTDPVGRVGEKYSYSDSGYILLGHIIERITGEPLAKAVRTLLRLDELNVGSTWWELSERDRMPRAHQMFEGLDTHDWDASIDLYGGGGLVATPADVATFFHALFTGKIFDSKETLKLMLSAEGLPVTSPYRLGVLVYDLDGQRYYGHSGFWGTFVAHDFATGATFAAAAYDRRGLLDGKRATTHWQFADLLQRMYPQVEVDADVLYIDEGAVMTSAGSAAAIDLCLHLVRKDYGAQAANHIARRLVISPHRDGGQAQFIERPMHKRENTLLAGVLDRMSRRLAEDFSVPDLAKMAAMSERTFMRRFKEATGSTPADWLRVARVDRARQLLESSSASIETVAQECGFRTATTLREHFRKKLGVSPSAYKNRFAKAAEGGRLDGRARVDASIDSRAPTPSPARPPHSRRAARSSTMPARRTA